MSKPSWTPQQQLTIDRRDRNILVAAAAGAGKTAVLVERIVKKITDVNNPCDIDQLLVVTFTNAAAAEMRARIGSALEDKLLLDPENDHIRRQASLLHSAHISTIDSFCQSILRNYFHIIDLDPVYTVGDENDLKIMKQEVLESVLEEKYSESSEQNMDFVNFTYIFSNGRTDKKIEELILKVYSTSQSFPWPVEWIDNCIEMYSSTTVEEMKQCKWNKKLMKIFNLYIDNFIKIAQKCRKICLLENGPDKYLENFQSDIEQLMVLHDVNDFEELYRKFNNINWSALSRKKMQEGCDPLLKEKAKNLRDIYKKEIEKIQKNYFYQSPENMLEDLIAMREPVKVLLSVTKDFMLAYEERKREEQILDFSDIEHKALEVLTRRDEDGNVYPSDVALELQGYYKEIITDEYQDSNDVQELLLTSLCGKEAQSPYFFMVGDVKQSIYKFRMARPDIFLRKYKSFTVGKGPNERINLGKNFRSREKVLESSNAIFAKIMKEDLGGIEYDEDAKLIPGSVFANNPDEDYKTEIMLIKEDKEDVNSDKISVEAAVIGNKIRQIVQGDKPMLLDKKGELKPAKYSDIAILLRSAKGWTETFVEVLNDMGIPAYAETKTGYFQTLEVQAILNYLRIIDNPRQDIPYVAVLRSYFGGFTDEELANIGAIRDEINYVDKMVSYIQQGEDDELIKKINDFTSKLNDYRQYVMTHSVYEILQRMYHETGYYYFMTAMPAGEKRKANLDILLQQSLQFARNGHYGIYGFTRYIESLTKSNVDFGEASINGEGTNAVRIMTIHKSKGLEFPITFVAGMGKNFNKSDTKATAVIDSDYGIGSTLVDLSLRIKRKTLARRFIELKTNLDMIAEEIRILYVALTRAKEKLYITGVAEKLNSKLQKWYNNCDDVDFVARSKAESFLDLIVPSVLGRSGIKNKVQDCLENKDINLEAEDVEQLFKISIIEAKDVLENEKEEIIENTISKKVIDDFDINVDYDTEIKESIEKQESFVYQYESESDIPVKMSVSRIKMEKMKELDEEKLKEDILIMDEPLEKSDQEIEIPKPHFLEEAKEMSGAKRGTLYHLVMEHFPYREIFDSSEKWDKNKFDEFLMSLVSSGYMSIEEKMLLNSVKFLKFMESPLGMRMKNAAVRGELKLEQPFIMGVPAKEIYPEKDTETFVMVQGIIDAYFIENNEIVLVDYKTDSVKKGGCEYLKEKYRAQIELYERALQNITGKKVKEKILYSFSVDKEVKY